LHFNPFFLVFLGEVFLQCFETLFEFLFSFSVCLIDRIF